MWSLRINETRIPCENVLPLKVCCYFIVVVLSPPLNSTSLPLSHDFLQHPFVIVFSLTTCNQRHIRFYFILNTITHSHHIYIVQLLENILLGVHLLLNKNIRDETPLADINCKIVISKCSLISIGLCVIN